MPADDARFKIDSEKFVKRTIIEKVKCPKCKEGYLERDQDNGQFALRDRFASERMGGNKKSYVHECTNCKASIPLDDYYPKEYEELVPLAENDGK